MKTQRKLKLLPAIIIAILLVFIRYLLPLVIPNATMVSLFGGLLLSLAIFIWWLFFSKISIIDRIGAFIIMVVSLVLTSFFLHMSIATANMGLMFILFSIPVSGVAFVAGLLLTQKLELKNRRIAMIVIIIVSSFFWTFLRTDGMTGEARQKLAWRWAKTAEEKLLSVSGDEHSIKIANQELKAEWPGFRGIKRNASYPGLKINTNWDANLPEELWRRPIGPGCSSCAIGNKYFYTQEQRGEYEMVTCYNLNTGELIWSHSDSVRFWDSHAGAGPRSTPTICNELLYSLGATGVLNALNTSDGSVVWSHDAATGTGKDLPGWGFTSSPLVINDLVYVAIAGKINAYNRFSGELSWTGPDGGGSYSSPHMVTINEIRQVLLMSQAGLTSFDPATGEILWQHNCPEEHIVQPALINENELLISAGQNIGMRRLAANFINNEWKIETLWTSPAMKTNFNDFVIHNGNIYGFHGPLLTCLDLNTGELKWKGGRYSGQSILLPDQDLLIVLTEKGELALVEAKPDKFTELHQMKVLEGKTWNHPAIAGNVLLIRNSTEMAAYRLPEI